MSNQNNGGPAFPLPAEQCVYDQNQGMIGTEGYGRHAEFGMSLRDYFAGKSIQGMLAALDASGLNYSNPTMMAQHAYAFADAMLAARGEP